MPINPSKLIAPALTIARPVLAEARSLWHRRGATPLEQVDPASLDCELDGALDVLCGNGASIPDWLLKQVAALISNRPFIFADEGVRGWLRRNDVRRSLKQAALDAIAHRDVDVWREGAAQIYANDTEDGAWYGAVAFDFALAYLLRALDAKIPFETRVAIGVVTRQNERLEDLLVQQNSTLESFMALLLNSALMERAEERGLTLVQIENLLARFGHAGAPIDQAEKLLLGAAEQLQHVRARLVQLSDADPEVAQWKGEAIAAIDAGDLDIARNLLRWAADRDLAAVAEIEANRRSRRLSASDSVAQLARLASAQAAFGDAATEFGRAAHIAEPVDLDIAWWHWIEAATAHARSAAVFPDIAASRAAVDTVRRHALPLALATGDAVKLQRARYELALDLLDLAARVPESEAAALRAEALSEARLAYDALPADANALLRISALDQIGDIELAIGQATAGGAGVDACRAAVAAYQQALELAKVRSPESQAHYEASLGAALRTLSDRVAEPEATRMLDTAIAAYRRAIDLGASDSAEDRAGRLNLLGAAYLAAGERGGANLGTEFTQTALSLFQEASQVIDQKLQPLVWAQTVANAAIAERRLAKGTRAAAGLQSAIMHYRSILPIYSARETPVEWARTRNNLASALLSVGLTRTDDADAAVEIEAAIVELEGALTVRNAIPTSIGWLTVQNNLGLAYRHLAARRDGDEALTWLRRSVATLAAVVAARSIDSEPIDWAGAAANLAMSEALLAQALGAPQLFDAALVRLDTAVAVFEREQHAAGLAEARRYREALEEERATIGGAP